MARVYSAFDLRLQRDVALKVLQSFAQQHTDFAERFRHEAQILASLRHPNIVQVYDYGVQDDVSFIVQQLHSGPTLEQELAALAAQGCLMERTSVEQVLMQLLIRSIMRTVANSSIVTSSPATSSVTSEVMSW
jgi:serine/threonine-protein kinase